MATVNPDLLKLYRDQSFNLIPGRRLASQYEAIEFVNQRGFIFFWPITGIDLPSLWVATAGNRPVPNQHDDPGHITWDWKDSLLDKHVWYYARLLGRRNTIISLSTAKYFYALSPNYGDPENDYVQQYQQGLLSLEAKQIYETLLHEGPMHSIELRKAAKLSNPENSTRFNRGLDTLQIEMKVVPVGIAKAGAWRYAFIYDLVHRHLPDLPTRAREISEFQARQHLLYLYLKSVGVSKTEKINALFGWKSEDTQRAIKHLACEGKIGLNIDIPKETTHTKDKNSWVGLSELVMDVDEDQESVIDI